jgi:HEAT repeat protein
MFSTTLTRFLLFGGIGLGIVGLGAVAEPAERDMAELLDGLKSPIKAKRMKAMKELGLKGTAAKAAVAPLIEHMRHHKDKDLANQAAQTLAQIGVPAVGELIKALEDPAPAVQIRALSALGIIGPEAGKGIGPISRLLENKDAKIRALAAWTLGEIGPPARPVAESLAKALRDADANVRRLAAEALHEIGSEMVSRLLPVLKDDDLGVRLSAVQALAVFHERKEAVQALVDALRDSKTKVRATAAGTLVRLGRDAKAALPSLLDNLKEPDLELQTKALTAIMAIGSHADSGLLDNLRSINQEQRWAAPYVLKQFGSKPSDAVKPLLRLLKDADAGNRLGAVLALTKLGRFPKSTVPSLKKALNDGNLAVRAAATIALPAIDSRLPKDVEEVGRLITRFVEDLKDSDEMDPDKVVQLYILVSTVSGSGFLGDQADGKMKSQIQGTMKWSSEAVDKLAPLAMPALVRGINTVAQFKLGYTEPFSRLSLKFLALLQASEDIQSLIYASNYLGNGVSNDSPYVPSLRQNRFRILIDSMLLEKRTDETALNVSELVKFLGSDFGHIHICGGVRSVLALRVYFHNFQVDNRKKQVDYSVKREKLALQLLLRIEKQKRFIKTEELTRKLWNKPIPFLLEKLTDPDPTVRWVAVQIISRKRIPAEKELIKLLGDPKAEVREAAHHALVRLGRTIDFGLQPRLWTAWLGIQEPSTYRPAPPDEPLDLDFHLGEKKKIRGEKSDPKKGIDKKSPGEKNDLKNGIEKKSPGEKTGLSMAAPCPFLPPRRECTRELASVDWIFRRRFG